MNNSKHYSLLFLFISTILLNCGGESRCWQKFDPKPPTKKCLKSIIAFSRSDIWCVGDRGTILHYNGKTWESFNITKQTLYCVNGTSSNDIWIAGFNSTVLHFDGKKWTKVSPDLIKLDGYFVTLCINLDNGYEVLLGGFRPQKTLIRFLRKIIPSAKIVTDLGLLLPYEKGVLYRINNNGWREISLPDDVLKVNDIKTFSNGETIITTNTYNLYWFIGSGFKKQKIHAIPNKIWGPTSKKFWITLHPLTWLESSLCKYDHSRVKKENIEKIPFLKGLGGIHGIGEEAWAVGPLRSIYHYSNGSWELEEYDGYYGMFQFLSRDAYLMYDVYALSLNNVFAVGDCGALLEYKGRNFRK